MLAYSVKRLFTLIPTLLAASILVFLFVHLIPGDPAAILLGDTATPEEVAQLSAEMGFDRPLWIQYFLWLGDVLQGNLGTSIFFREPVLSVIGSGAETSILLASMTMVWIIIIGLPIGVLSATKHGTWVDQITSSGAMLAASIPTFWLGLYLIMIFSVTLGWFPSSGFPSLSDDGGITNLRYLTAATQAGPIARVATTSRMPPLTDHPKRTRLGRVVPVSFVDQVNVVAGAGAAMRENLGHHALYDLLLFVRGVPGGPFGLSQDRTGKVSFPFLAAAGH